MEQHLSMAIPEAQHFLELHFQEQNQTLKTGKVYQSQRPATWTQVFKRLTVFLHAAACHKL